MNPHKKGEHVFNDIAGSVENSFQGAVTTPRLHSLALTGPHGPLRIQELPRTCAGIDQFRRDRILTEARTVVAPATGLHDDVNSRTYGEAKGKLEQALGDAVVAKAFLIWSSKPRSNSSFHEFEQIVQGLRDSKTCIETARLAMTKLIESGMDPGAEKSALAERVSDVELKRRRTAIDAMKNHRQTLIQNGLALITTFADEVEAVLGSRINGR